MIFLKLFVEIMEAFLPPHIFQKAGAIFGVLIPKASAFFQNGGSIHVQDT